jgi:hypothetical protein
MASQMFGVTGNRRLKRNQKSELNARLLQLPSILAAEQAAEQQRKDQAFKEKELAQNKKMAREEMKFKRSEAKRGFGLEVGKLGINIGTSNLLGGQTIGSLGTQIKGLFTGGAQKQGSPTTSFQPHGTPNRAMSGIPKSGGGFFSGVPISSIASGGLAGFGAGSLFGGESKSKKLLYGGLAGAGLGLLSGGLSGALGGAAGGLFGGMIG